MKIYKQPALVNKLRYSCQKSQLDKKIKTEDTKFKVVEKQDNNVFRQFAICPFSSRSTEITH